MKSPNTVRRIIALLLAVQALLGRGPTAARASGILLDVNQMTIHEAYNIGMLRGKVDGVWFLSLWSPEITQAGLWPAVFDVLNAPNFVVSEDVLNYPQPGPSFDYDNLVRMGVRPRAAMVYNEWPAIDSCLSRAEIDALPPGSYGDKLVLNCRRFRDEPLISRFWKSNLMRSLSHPRVTGACFEVGPGFANFFDNRIAEGVNRVLASGKSCFVLLPPNPTSANSSTYRQSVMESLSFLSVHGVPLQAPNLYFVLAVYSRAEKEVSFLFGQVGDTRGFGDNSIQAAVDSLHARRELLKARPNHETNPLPNESYVLFNRNCDAFLEDAVDAPGSRVNTVRLSRTNEVPNLVNRRWTFRPAGAGAFSVWTADGTHCLSVDPSRPTANTVLLLDKRSVPKPSNSQLWRLSVADTRSVTIQNVASGRFLQSQSPRPGTLIVQSATTASRAQRWQLRILW